MVDPTVYTRRLTLRWKDLAMETEMARMIGVAASIISAVCVVVIMAALIVGKRSERGHDDED